MSDVAAQSAHRAFLNQYYGISRHFYDASRKYFLLGRDPELRRLSREAWSSLIEVGPGTGRNLRALHQMRPEATYGGLEASDEMAEHARKACPFARIIRGFAEDTALDVVFGMRPERILFSYCLSMVLDPGKAVDTALSALARGGEVVVVDFGDLGHMPTMLRESFGRFLAHYHVHPLDPKLFERRGAPVEYGAGRYVLRARLRAS